MKFELVVALLSCLVFAGCIGSEGSPPPAAQLAAAGDTVRINYVGRLEDGAVFDTSLENEAIKAGLPLRPKYELLEFVVGSGAVIKGFDDAVLGMSAGEFKTVSISPENGYGDRDESLVMEYPKSVFQNNGSNLEVGQYIMSRSGQQGKVVVVGAENFTVDYNHFLAGRTLTFEITLVELVKG
ncbi:MAG: peptidylprolyl isomerase [Candidatus Micrarchaeia archaeon]